MVMRWGLSDKLGPLAYGDQQEEVFLGYSMGQRNHISEETTKIIDSEIRRIVEDGYVKARDIITAKREDLEVLARGLLEYETLSGEEIINLLKGQKPNREEPSDSDAPKPQSSVPTGGRGRPGGFGEPAPQPG